MNNQRDTERGKARDAEREREREREREKHGNKNQTLGGERFPSARQRARERASSAARPRSSLTRLHKTRASIDNTGHT